MPNATVSPTVTESPSAPKDTPFWMINFSNPLTLLFYYGLGFGLLLMLAGLILFIRKRLKQTPPKSLRGSLDALKQRNNQLNSVKNRILASQDTGYSGGAGNSLARTGLSAASQPAEYQQPIGQGATVR